MKARLLILWIYCLLLSVGARAQYGSDLGPRALSTLAWDHISSAYGTGGGDPAGSIGLTTDKRMYVWGSNTNFTIHKVFTANEANTIFKPKYQTTPFYVPSPAGETIKKVQTKNSYGYNIAGSTFFALSESGKLYAWGYNNGLLATTWPAVPTVSDANANVFSLADTARARRTPTQLTILTESNFVDFDVSRYGNYWIAIGASGKAYHIGNNGAISGGSGTDDQYTFAALPNPAGVDNATFKYTRVWVGQERFYYPVAYLKGNDGKLYYTSSFRVNYTSGIPSRFTRIWPAPNLTLNEELGKIRGIVPNEVPSLAGVDVVKMDIGLITSDRQTTYALSADGKAYMTGLWKARTTAVATNGRTFTVVPLKTAPQSLDVDVTYQNGQQDTTYSLKKFVEIAIPPGATKILDIMSHDKLAVIGGDFGSSVVGDNHKVYWSGTIYTGSPKVILASNYLSVSPVLSTYSYQCYDIYQSATTTPYTWSQESVNLEGTSQLSFISETSNQICIISKTGRGYFLGNMSPNAGIGKAMVGNWGYYVFPQPIANEQLLDCQTSPGTGGPLTAGPVVPTNTAVGTIDCSKTKLYPTPVAGVPSQLSLIVTVNVTTIGDFTPVTVSGSGMSLPSDFSTVSATTTGVQQFHIPLNYDGTALTNAFQFTVGSAGSCSADLTQKPNKQVTNVWSLTNCSTVTPGVLSK